MNVEALHQKLGDGPWPENVLNEEIRRLANIPDWDRAAVSVAFAMLRNAGGIRHVRVDEGDTVRAEWLKGDLFKPLTEAEKQARRTREEREEHDRADALTARQNAQAPLPYRSLNRPMRDLVETVLRHHKLID